MGRIFWQFVGVLLLIGFVGAYFWWIVAALAVVALLTRHLAITMVGRHGEEKARAMLQKVILDADEADQWGN